METFQTRRLQQRSDIDFGHVKYVAGGLTEADADADGRDRQEPDLSQRIIGESPPLRRVRRDIECFARSSAPVLITGESGTGKELAARMIHENSSRSKEPFVAVNCGGVPPTLIATELFGHERGSFTGASHMKKGLIEAADGGTLFLDEIGDLPIEAQPVLLRFLQDSMVDRIGSLRSTPVNVRVISATNKNIEALAADGTFRQDLLYRLNMLSLSLPPLRDCRSDILRITGHYLTVMSAEREKAAPRLAESAEKVLLGYAWPGNVRELIGRIHRALATGDTPWLTAEEFGFRQRERRRSQRGTAALSGTQTLQTDSPVRDDGPLPNAPQTPEAPPPWDVGPGWTLATARTHAEVMLIRKALSDHRNCKDKVAKQLGISRVTLYRLLKRHNIE